MTTVITRQQHGTGWVKDRPSKKDLRFSAPLEEDGTLPTLPTSVTDLYTPPRRDQKRTNSCVGQASASLYEYMLYVMNAANVFHPSALFNYWLARHVPRRGWEDEDEGAMPRDAMQSMISNGVLPDEDWPFTEDPSVVNQEPPKLLQRKAKSNRIVEGKYVRMKADDNLFHLKYSLAQGLPFLIGIPVYTSFYDVGADGVVPMPKDGEMLEGFHLMYSNGYDDSTRLFKTPNSWGTEVGDYGVYYLPYNYVTMFSDDFWRIEAIT